MFQERVNWCLLPASLPPFKVPLNNRGRNPDMALLLWNTGQVMNTQKAVNRTQACECRQEFPKALPGESSDYLKENLTFYFKKMKEKEEKIVFLITPHVENTGRV